jgi:hypothetical protein
MFLVNLRQSWPAVKAGTRTAAEVTLGEWAQLPDGALAEYGDVILGIYDNEVVSAFDIDGWSRDPDNDRVTFTGTESETWAHLVGGPNPGPRWKQGQAGPVQYLDTAEVEGPAS